MFEEKFMEYEEREQLKQKGWDLAVTAETLQGKANGFLAVIESHYWRQRESFEYSKLKKSRLRKVAGKKYYRGYELDFEDYARHWLHSMGHFIPNEVKDFIKKEMGLHPIKCEFLPEGMTLYQFN